MQAKHCWPGPSQGKQKFLFSSLLAQVRQITNTCCYLSTLLNPSNNLYIFVYNRVWGNVCGCGGKESERLVRSGKSKNTLHHLHRWDWRYWRQQVSSALQLFYVYCVALLRHCLYWYVLTTAPFHLVINKIHFFWSPLFCLYRQASHPSLTWTSTLYPY